MKNLTWQNPGALGFAACHKQEPLVAQELISKVKSKCCGIKDKMNVAFSRAKSKLIIVGNIEQIKNISSSEYPHLRKMVESEYVKFV